MSALDLRLYAVADPSLIEGDPVAAVGSAVAGGATLVQLRDKRGDIRATVELARALRAALPLSVPLLVNDRVDVALAAGADGVHLGQHDLDPADARRLLGEDAIIGLTVHHAREATTAVRIDYVGLGPVYATGSKDPGDPPLGPAGLARLIGEVRARMGPLPACAIAGIDAGRAGAVIGAGVDGVAVIGALFKAPDIAAAAAELRAVVDRELAQRKRP